MTFKGTKCRQQESVCRLPRTAFIASYLTLLIGLDLAAQIPDQVSEPSGSQRTLSFDIDELSSTASLTDSIRNCAVMSVEGDRHGPIFSVSGLLVDPEGKPVSGATVLLRESCQRRASRATGWRGNERDRALLAVGDVFAKAISNEAGEFRFENVKSPELPFMFPRAHWNWNLLAATESQVGFFELHTGVLPRKYEHDIDITMRPIRSIEGTVTDPDGKLVKGALVQLDGLKEPVPVTGGSLGEISLWTSNASVLAMTGDDGVFRFDGLPLGRAAMVLAHHPDFSQSGTLIATSDDGLLGNVREDRNARDAGARAVPSPATLKLGLRALIKGKVEAAGEPVAGAWVKPKHSKFGVQSNAKGEFEWGQPYTTPFQMVIEPPEEEAYLLPAELNLTKQELTASDVVSVELKPGALVTGYLPSESGLPPATFVLAVDVVTSKTSTSLVDEAGKYQFLLAPGDYTFFPCTRYVGSGLPTAHEIAKAAQRGQISEDWPQVSFGVKASDIRRIVQLEALSIGPLSEDVQEVLVLLPDGTPAGNAEVEIEEPKPLLDRFAIEKTVSYPTLSNAGGVAKVIRLDELSDNAWVKAKLATADLPYAGRANIAEVNEQGQVVVQMEQGYRIRGRVLLNGEPLSGARVSVGCSVRTGRSSSRTTDHRMVLTRVDGTFVARMIPAERYHVMVYGIPGSTELIGLGHSASRSEADPVTREIQVKEFSLLRGDEIIEGQVVDANRKPIANARISVGLAKVGESNLIGYREASQLTTDEDGRFRIQNLPRGAFEVSAFARVGGQTASGSTSASVESGAQRVIIRVDLTQPKQIRTLQPEAVTDF